MRRSTVLLLVILAACGSSGTRGDSVPPDDVVDECRPGATTACIAGKQRTCAAGGGRAHRLLYDSLPPLTVGAGGLVRVEHLGGTLFGTDSTRWLACFAECPDGGPQNVCFPLALSLRLSWSAGARCTTREREVGPWQGRASRALDLTCPDGDGSITFVPELDLVRRDLVSAGAIDGSDLLAKLDGLAVEMRAGGAVQSRLGAAEPSRCDVFTPPAGYRVIGDGKAFADLESAASEPASALATEVEKIRAGVAAAAVQQAKASIIPAFRQQHGESCRARGFDPADDAKLEACAAATKETEAPFRAAVARETARLMGERRGELDELTRRLLVAPLCRHYAGAPS